MMLGFCPGLSCVMTHVMLRKVVKTISCINAQDVLPEELIIEIRKYIEGEAIYIPRSAGRAKWGVQTGARAELDRRNRDIRIAFENGVTVEELSTKYCLCCDSIRKILRKAQPALF